MFKENMKYKFRSEEDFTKFSEISYTNYNIAQAIQDAGGVFTIALDLEYGHTYKVVYVDGCRLKPLYCSYPFLDDSEFCFFEEVIPKVDEVKSTFTATQAFDEAVASVREFKGGTFSKEVEDILQLIGLLLN